jgi:hypothetical protein
MKKILTTFAGYSYTLKLSQLRLIEQAKKHFNGCATFDENSPQIVQLFHQYKEISQYRRGAGFWMWKPFIILKTFESLDNGDFVFYMDSGTDIIDDLTPLFKLCEKNNGFLFFENRSGNPTGNIWTNDLWTKKDCFILTDCDSEKFYKASQVDGAYILLQKNDTTVLFLQEYFKYCTDRRIITDEPNTLGENLPQFIDHRHDQSILSLLVKKYNFNLYPQPSEVGNSHRPPDCPYKQLFLHHRGTIFGRV